MLCEDRSAMTGSTRAPSIQTWAKPPVARFLCRPLVMGTRGAKAAVIAARMCWGEKSSPTSYDLGNQSGKLGKSCAVRLLWRLLYLWMK